MYGGAVCALFVARRGNVGASTYANERKVALRIDSNAHWKTKLSAGADAVVEALAAAGERGGLPGLGIDLADAMVFPVLDCAKRVPTL